MRLWHRIALLSTFSVVLTVVLVVTIQSAYLGRAVRQFNPAFQDVITQLQSTPNLGQEERLELFRTALLRTANDPAEFEQYVAQLSTVLDMQRRLPRLAALIGLLIVLPLAAGVAWLIAQPIRGVSRSATQIAGGDLGARALPSWQTSGKGELAELAHNFNGMAETLERLEHERQEMITDLAHELRTPLAILQGQIDAMREGVRPLDQAALAKLDGQTQRLGRLIDDLRTLSLADAGRLSLEPVDIALVPFVQHLVDSFGEVAAKSSISLIFEASLERSVKLAADPNRLEQAFSKLLENALRRAPERSTIKISLSEEANMLRLDMKDSGPHLPAGALSYIFDRFSYAQTGQQHNSGGLDLAVVRTLAELHRGYVKAANCSAGGGVFTVFLPIQTSVVASTS